MWKIYRSVVMVGLIVMALVLLQRGEWTLALINVMVSLLMWIDNE